MPESSVMYKWIRLSFTLLFVFFGLTLFASPGHAQSCSLADVNAVNTLYGTAGNGGADVLRIDFRNVNTISCGRVNGNANNAPNGRVELSHCRNNRPADLCFVVDSTRNNGIPFMTNVNLSGPGLPAGGISPADDADVDLSAGTYTVIAYGGRHAS